MSIRALETHYRGYRFRSRLEARWAVFMDAARVRWEYEPEGYDLGGTRYLPDFWLPENRTFLEIKPARGEHVDEKPLAAVRAGGEMFRHGTSAQRRMVVAYGDPLAAESDRIYWLGEPWVSKSGGPQVCPSCRSLQFDERVSSVTKVWRTDCACGTWTLPTFQAFVADAGLVARQARFEHGEQPSLTARMEHRWHDANPSIYLAGKIDSADWREEIGVQPGEYDQKSGPRFEIGSLIDAKYGAWRYNGPDLSVMHTELMHGVANDCLRRLARTNTLFAWIDSADVHGTMAELGFWHGLGAGEMAGFTFVAFSSRELRSEVWFAAELATVAVVVPTIRQAWDAFLEWNEYGRCYLDTLS